MDLFLVMQQRLHDQHREVRDLHRKFLMLAVSGCVLLVLAVYQSPCMSTVLSGTSGGEKSGTVHILLFLVACAVAYLLLGKALATLSTAGPINTTTLSQTYGTTVRSPSSGYFHFLPPPNIIEVFSPGQRVCFVYIYPISTALSLLFGAFSTLWYCYLIVQIASMTLFIQCAHQLSKLNTAR